ncbi:MAG: DEAD/DEAH box helicase family protein, partial [Deltaproteobacteria bacterium]|nr:DEAD/DEAH box helicase family protein [Deltaproteobacteria bacterium]
MPISTSCTPGLPMSDSPKLRLTFEGGTICLYGLTEPTGPLPAQLVWDDRLAALRAPAVAYAEVVLWVRDRGLTVEDEARAYRKLPQSDITRQSPFPYQSEAIDAWKAQQCRGVVVLPTGSGKTFVAMLAMDGRPRSTLVVVPTLDLLNQWYDELSAAFSQPVGLIGGGYHEPADLTVTTYDSAYLHMDRLGNRYGMVVFDECHHLPSESYAMAARACLAPFRLGLTAT